MADLPSKTQLDTLGERLRDGSPDPADIRTLDDYRLSFGEAYEFVSAALLNEGLRATGRPSKTTTSIIEKLNRQNIRLTQIQDIAGLRLIVSGVVDQNRTVDQLRALFSKVTVVDRRVKSSHGYRAVHVVVSKDDRAIEIQVRTRAQHLWAEISEKLSDSVDAAVKYGGGPAETRDQLALYSDVVQSIEDSELELIVSRQEQAALQRESEVLVSADPDYLRLVRLVEARRKLILEREVAEKRFRTELIDLLERAYNEIGRSS